MQAPVGHLSYSSIATYLMCGRSWQLRYIEKISAPTSPSLFFGGAFHEAIETYVALDGHKKPDGSPIDCWNDAWAKKLQEEGDAVAWGENSPEELRQNGIHILSSPEVLRTLERISPSLDEKGRHRIEFPVRMTVPGVPVPIVGYVDMIESDGVPVDFKTSGYSWNSNRARKELQPTVYLAALEQSGFKENRERVFRHYVFTKTKTPRAQVIETTREDADFRFMEDLIRSAWKGIQAGIFVPNPLTWKCSEAYCEYWQTCRARAAVS